MSFHSTSSLAISLRVNPLSVRRSLAAMCVVLSLTAQPAKAGELREATSTLRDGRIGYVLTHRYYSLYETEGGKAECPQGFNDGPREQFKKLYPPGKKLSVIDAQLQWEGSQWHPSTSKYRLPFHEGQGRISFGLNLDGKVGAEDFLSPTGEPGIDNEFYRAIACIDSFRVGGSLYNFENTFLQQYPDSRLLIELTQVDDLVNDEEVIVTTYRGMNPLLSDASGKHYLPGGTQRVDLRWSKDYVFKLKGKIVDGVLTTDPIDWIMVPWAMTANVTAFQEFRGMRLKLKVTPERAEGLMAGFIDVQRWHHALNTNLSTHHMSYGRVSSPSVVAALARLADGYPDQTGRNTAISASVDLKMVQVYLVHPTSKADLISSNR